MRASIASVVAAGGIMLLAGGAAAEGGLVGVWELVSVTTRDLQNGDVATPLGETPSGRLTYTDTGHVSVVITAEDRAPLGDLQGASSEAKSALYQSMVAYAGTYTFDEFSVTHEIEASWLPDWIGTDQVRTVTLDGNDLTLATPPIENLIWTLRWRRVD